MKFMPWSTVLFIQEGARVAFCRFDPLCHWNIGKGSRVGIAGLGGLGTMGVKLAKALGAEVTVLSRSTAKKEYAMSECLTYPLFE